MGQGQPLLIFVSGAVELGVSQVPLPFETAGAGNLVEPRSLDEVPD